jgi:hypothetical protein
MFNVNENIFDIFKSQLQHSWIPMDDLNKNRSHMGLSPSQFPKENHSVLVIGNYDPSSNTSEILTENGWENLLPELPVTIFDTCSVLLNSTTVMVIGGIQNGATSRNTFLFNTKVGEESWTEGPTLLTERSVHSCARIRSEFRVPNSNISSQFGIIVAGGSLNTSTEILDFGTVSLSLSLSLSLSSISPLCLSLSLSISPFITLSLSLSISPLSFTIHA